MKIIELEKLKSNGVDFGYIGVEYETGNIRYFTYYNEGIYYSNRLFELDFKNSSVLKWYNEKNGYFRTHLDEHLPLELKNLTYSLIKKHEDFNKKNKYPTKYLEYNKKFLSFIYDYRLIFLGGIAAYSLLENKICFDVNSSMWQGLDNDYKKKYTDALLHELGHMKVARVVFNEKNNQIEIFSGFCREDSDFEPIFLDNGDIFYKYNKSKPLFELDGLTLLEEIMNDYDCKRIDPDYIGFYPDLGEYLEKLCDGELLYARYTDGIETYYRCLTNIINSKDLASELLERMIELTYLENDKNKEKVMKIINYYNERKTR